MGISHEISYGFVPVRRSPSGLDFLVVQCRRNGHFFFPKGHKDKYEMPIQAAIRELWEESGHVPDEFWTGSAWSREVSAATEVYRENYVFRKRSGRETNKICIYFLAVVHMRGPIQDTKEIAEVRWMPAIESSAQIFDFDSKRNEFLSHVLPCLQRAVALPSV